jgi:hypothetical protein
MAEKVKEFAGLSLSKIGDLGVQILNEQNNKEEQTSSL